MVWKQLNVPHSFTLEASFCGPDYGPLQGAHFNTAHLQQMGAACIGRYSEIHREIYRDI